MIRRILLPAVSLFLAVTCLASAQVVSIDNYTKSDYIRKPLFLEQDKIYGRVVSFSPGLEIICRQDKVKAEIAGLGTYYTPVDLNGIPAGDYRVSLSKSGFYSAEFQITISPGKRTSVTVELKPMIARLTLQGLPEKRSVFINNQQIKSDIAEVPPGEISLRITAFGYEDYFTVLTVKPGDDVSFRPVLKKKPFALESLKSNRAAVWLNDSPSQKKIVFSVIAAAPGKAHYSYTDLTNHNVLEEGDLALTDRKTLIPFDCNSSPYDGPGDYRLSVESSDGEKTFILAETVSVNKGGRARWRNVSVSSGGFLFCPDSRTLPSGLTQIQTGVTAAFTAKDLNSLSVPSYLSIRTSLGDRVELAGGTSLYLSPEITESSLDIFASGKIALIPPDHSGVFSLAALTTVNYNGKISSFESIAPSDPYGGISGLSLSIPAGITWKYLSFILAPEIRISPSYPLTEPGGFTSGKLYIWNYIRGAIVWDRGIFSGALSGALQTPSYSDGKGQWPFFSGINLDLTPGITGFTVSFYGGLRYCSGDPLQISAGASAGFMF